MNDMVEIVDPVDDVVGGEALDVVDLGDAVTETKQYQYLPWYADNATVFGWPY